MKTSVKRSFAIAASGTILTVLAGCSSTTEKRAYQAPAAFSQSELADQGLIAAGDNPTLEGLPEAGVDPALDRLWKARRDNTKDFAVGPGDVLELQVPAVKELADQTVRVDGQGNIDLPLLGSNHVAGLSESELNSALVSKLSEYVYRPQAEIFVKSYNNRQVAVTGEVRAPADYVLNGPQDTVRDLIQRAGGMTQQASPEIVLTPGTNGLNKDVPQPALAEAKHAETSYNPPSEAPGNNTLQLNQTSTTFGSPLIIDLSRNSHQTRYLDLPVRPGDTIFVPLAGSVSTIGWVYRTQTMPITHNLSLMGAVAASGGTMYAADEHNVKILRRQTGGQRAVMTFDIESIQEGKSPDVPLRDGDIIDVSYSAIKIPGYALYYATQGLVSFAPAALLVSGL